MDSAVAGFVDRSDRMQHAVNEILHREAANVLDATVRCRLAGALLDLAVEHRYAVMALFRADCIGSAFALVRCVMETALRGAWLGLCATDEQIERVCKEDGFPSIREVLLPGVLAFAASKSVKLASAFELISQVQAGQWGSLCGFTHGGAQAGANRITAEDIGPNYKEVDQERMILLSSFCAALACAAMCWLGGRDDVAELIAEPLGNPAFVD